MPLYEHQGRRPRIGRGAFVAANATVIGDVTLGDESSVWFGVVGRGDVMPIAVGARTNIQDGSVVHVTGGKTRTLVGDDVTAGHMVLLHGCTVESSVLVGMGSIVLDGAVIEEGCVVGAGSLVTPGTRIPRGSVAMGRPARVVRAVTDEDRAWIAASSQGYVENARVFLSSAVRLIE
jgi:carbonic anhydrase/acetyltransferase-like protein (isoleucine patch superfamily)